MSLLGAGVLANFHDVDRGAESSFNAWHTHEHILERVSLPGFLRGRRYVALSGEPKYLIIYEVEKIETLCAPEYIARLNNPTKWTQEIASHLTLTIRTAARVIASTGVGLGGVCAVWRLAQPIEDTDRWREWRDWLVNKPLATLAKHRDIVGAHLLEASQAASQVATKESELRRGPDRMSDLTLLVEGTCENDLLAACAGVSIRYPSDHGEPREPSLYRLQLVVTAN